MQAIAVSIRVRHVGFPSLVSKSGHDQRPASSDRVSPVEADPQQRALRAVLAAYQAPLLGRGLGQLASTFLPFFGLIAAMYALWWLVSPWLSLALTLPAAGLIVRIFIIQHDCGHGAFFRSRAANEWLGRFCSLITMTPFANWRRQHANHHAVWNNLDKRTGGADIYSTCLTVDEYRARSALGRWWYRAVRSPIVAQLLLPPLVFLLLSGAVRYAGRLAPRAQQRAVDRRRPALRGRFLEHLVYCAKRTHRGAEKLAKKPFEDWKDVLSNEHVCSTEQIWKAGK